MSLYETPWKATPEVLKAVDRKILAPIPFGYDVFNCYEVSALRTDKTPVAGIVRVHYHSNSLQLIDTRSLQLYLNSYNRLALGTTNLEVLQNLAMCVQYDLNNLIDAAVTVKAYAGDEAILKPVNYVDPNYNWLSTDTLRSLDSVSHEPRWGDVHVVTGNNTLAEHDLIRLLARYRFMIGLPEDIADLIYTCVSQFTNDLLVVVMYVRNHGIDSNLVRASNEKLLAYVNIDNLDYLQEKTPRQ